MKHKLNSGISSLNQYVFMIIGIGSLGFLIYSIIVLDFSSIIFCLVYIVFIYFFFVRKIKKFKEIEFDEKNIYFDNAKIPFEDIINIKLGKIVFKKDSKKSYVLFGFIPFSSSFNLLKEFYNNHKQQKENSNSKKPDRV